MVNQYLRAVRRRAYTLLVARALVFSLGAAALTFAIASLVCGLIPTSLRLAFAWTGVGLAALLAGWIGWRGAWSLRGEGVGGLLAVVDRRLASQTRSALELAGASPSGFSAGLAAAHVRAVSTALRKLPPARVAPVAWLRRRGVLAAAAAPFATAILVGALDHARAGAATLLTAGLGAAAAPLARGFIEQTRVRLVYPSYLGRPNSTLIDPTLIEVPHGTTILLTVRPRIAVSAGELRIGELRLQLRVASDGRLQGEFVADKDAALHFRLKRGVEWLSDGLERHVRVVRDQAPRPRIESPENSSLVELEEPIPIEFVAEDDTGVASVELVVRLPSGRLLRRPLWSEQGTHPARRRVRGQDTLRLADMGANPGDTPLLWLEARDGDEVTGPNVGRSETVALEVASAISRRTQHLERLQRIVSQMLDTLADRLENPVAGSPQTLRNRFRALQSATQDWLRALGRLSGQLEDQDLGMGLAVRLREVLRRQRRSLRSESLSQRRPPGSLQEARKQDATSIQTLETDTLLLADLLMQARLKDAEALARELASARDRLKELLARYRAAKTPEAQRAALAELARLQRNLRLLGNKIQQMARRIPGEFINVDALPKEATADAARQLREAIEQGDMKAAQQGFDNLASRIERLGRLLGDSSDGYARARFGPHDRAMSEALDRLALLAAEQGRLAGASADVLQDALGRLGSMPIPKAAKRDLSGRLDSVDRSLAKLAGGGLADSDRRVMERLRRRLADTRAALGTEDLGAARQMAAEARSDMEGLDRSLQIEAQMFGGHRGATARNARHAAEATRRMRALERQLKGLTPDASRLLDEGDRRRARANLKAQRNARVAARKLAERFETGPNNAPLSEDAAGALRDARQAMSRAEASLDAGEVQDALRAQRRAEDGLTRLQRRLARNSRRSGGGDGHGYDAADSGERVLIPGADQGSGPDELRRRLLEAMKESAPSAYRGAVSRYYQELLR